MSFLLKNFQKTLISKNCLKFHIKYNFSKESRDLKNKCIERKKLYAYGKELFTKNINELKENSFQGSLKYSSLILSNMTSYSVKNEELSKLTRMNIRDKLSQIKPDLILPLLIGILSTTEGDDHDISQKIYEYIDANVLDFNSKELEKIEHIYFLLDKKIALKFSAMFTDKIKLLKERMNADFHENTSIFLKGENIKTPTDVNITLYKKDAKVVILFKKTNQRLQLFGVNHLEMEEIVQLRKNLDLTKKCNFFIFEKLPFSLNEFETLKENEFGNETNNFKEDFRKSLLIPSINFNNISDPYFFLKKFEEVFFLDKGLLKFYIENMILKNKKEYDLHETQRIVFITDNGLKKPDELTTLLYILNEKNLDNIKVLFSDILSIEEIFHFTENLSVDDLKARIPYYRLFWLNTILQWISTVSKQGCPKCSKANKDSYNDLMNSFTKYDYDFSVRDKNFANKILTSLAMNQDEKEIIGFFGEDHLTEIVKYITEILNTDTNFFYKFKKNNYSTQEINEELAKSFKSKFNNWKNLDEQQIIEKINKGALIGTLMQKSELILPSIFKDKQNLFNNYHAEYSKLYQLNNYGKEFKFSKKFDSCYAVNSLFSENEK